MLSHYLITFGDTVALKIHTSPWIHLSPTLLISQLWDIDQYISILINTLPLCLVFIVLVWPYHSQHAEGDTFTAEWLESQGLFTALRGLQWCRTYSGIWQHALCVHVFVWMDGWVIEHVFVCAECVFFLAVCLTFVIKQVTPSSHFVTCFWSFKRHCPHGWINNFFNFYFFCIIKFYVLSFVFLL